MSDTEQLIWFVDLTVTQSSQLPIATTVRHGRSFDPMEIECPTWLGISSIPESSGHVSYILYFLATDGTRLDFAQRSTLAEAFAEVGKVVPVTQWKPCSVALNDYERIPRASIA